MSDSAKLTIKGQDYLLPLLKGSEGETAIDITKLRAESGVVTLDSGYGNTGACTSAITFLNGEQGILRYRGYSIEELCEKSHFTEVAYLLIHGELPNKKQLEQFEKSIADYRDVPDGVFKVIESFPEAAHPMGVLSASLASLSGFYPDLLDQDLSEEQKEKLIPQLLGQMKVLAAANYRHSKAKEYVKADANVDYCANFINLMFNEGDRASEVDPVVAKALDVLLILHADHEQNCSTSTVRLVGSSKANLFATISSGVNALWGPLHGGANQAVIEMLDQIHKAGGDYKKFLDRAKDKNDSFRLMGFGHRVYKNFDPRAKIIKSYCDQVLEKMGIDDPLLDIAKGLEEEALKDPYFVDRKLYPNVDFYSGIIYRALGIPTNMFTVMFALGRLPGWLAQWKEMIEDPKMRIGRPRQIYVGENDRHYQDIKER